MVFSLHLRKIGSKRRSGSKTDKECSPLSQPNPCPKDILDKSKSKHGDAVRKVQNREKSAKGSSTTTKSDELVKYMSNLPGYLQRADNRGENNREKKALNVGVLDWSRLEKWNSKQTHEPVLYRSFASFLSGEESSSRAATAPSTTHGTKASYKEGLPGSSKPSSRELETFGEILSRKSFQKEKRNDYDKQKENASDVKPKKSLESLQHHSLKKKERNHNPNSPRRVASLKPKSKGVSIGSQKKTSSVSIEAKTMMDHLQNPDVDFDVNHKQLHCKPSNIVLLRPRRVQQSSSAGFFELNSQSRTSFGEDVSESSQSSSFTFIPEEVYSEDVVCSEIPHSSSSLETLQHRFNTDADINPYTVVSEKPASSDNCFEEGIVDIKLRNQCAFGLNQIRRSFSWKDRSTVPQLSTKSGPLTSEYSATCFDHSTKGKPKGHKRTRSSPLLRLLDPILKHKASNMDHSDESLNSIGFANSEKSKGSSSIEALLQLTVKNGVPLFKFVLSGERKVLAATTKAFASLEEKDDAFSFYVVNEIKKKSGGWLSHVSKEKGCGYAYNMVGQMRFSSRRIDETSYQNRERRCIMVKEYVLLSVEIDQGPSTFANRKELAAVVIEIPCKYTNREGLNSSSSLKNGESDVCGGNTTAILPGGVHSSSMKGEPSPLIYRWKSGGTCDCGGWDVGCKLLLLSNKEKQPSSNVQRSSKSHLERFQLFVQEGAEQNTPLFTLAPLKEDGLYSVEFSSTIDNLQAFFISVAVLSTKKLPSSLEMRSNIDEEIDKEFGFKDENEPRGKAPITYNRIPPLSPVGRV